VRTARKAGAGGLLIVRADSAYYCHRVVAAARAGARRPQERPTGLLAVRYLELAGARP